MNDGEESHKSFIVIDDGCDPDFQCEVCGAESNHLPPTVSKDDIRAKRWAHYRTLIGRVYEEGLVELAKKDPRGWRV